MVDTQPFTVSEAFRCLAQAMTFDLWRRVEFLGFVALPERVRTRFGEALRTEPTEQCDLIISNADAKSPRNCNQLC
jgi:hypothetical protein